MIPSYGWLANTFAPAEQEGISFDPNLPTRRQEYALFADVVRSLRPEIALDLGTGYIPTWHVAPYIAAALGTEVHCVDMDPRTLTMPLHRSIIRECMSFLDETWVPPLLYYPLVYSISVFEHLPGEGHSRIARRLSEWLEPGGIFFLTVDGVDPAILAFLYSEWFDCGERSPDPDAHLQPAVSFLIGRRR